MMTNVVLCSGVLLYFFCAEVHIYSTGIVLIWTATQLNKCFLCTWFPLKSMQSKLVWPQVSPFHVWCAAPKSTYDKQAMNSNALELPLPGKAEQNLTAVHSVSTRQIDF